MKNQMSQFLRIANARLIKIYPNKQQRSAWAAKMYARWQQRRSLKYRLPHRAVHNRSSNENQDYTRGCKASRG